MKPVINKIGEKKLARRRGGSPLLWLLAVIALGGMLRFFAIGAKSLWVDEFYSLASAAGRYPDMRPLEFDRIMPRAPELASIQQARPIWHIWTSHREGTHPPLYLILLRLWEDCFGDSAVALRSFSALASLVALVLFWDVARLLFEAPWALWAAAIMAFAGPQIEFAQDGRPYALLLAFGVGAMDALVRIERRGPTILRLLALGLTMLAMALTHYFCFGALVAIGAYVLVRLRGGARVWTMVAIGGMAVLYLALWGPALWHQRHNTTFSFLIETAAHPKLVTLRRIDALPGRLLVHWDGSLRLFGAGFAFLALAGYLAWRRREALLPLVWLVLTAGFVAALDLGRNTRHLEWIRYVLLASPGLYLLIVAAAREISWTAGQAVAGVVAVGCLGAAFLYYADPNADWRGAAQFLQAQAAPGELVVFAGSEPWLAPAECIGFSYYAPDARRPVVVLSGPASPGLMEKIGEHKRVWLVSDAKVVGDISRFLPGGTPAETYFPFDTGNVFLVTFPSAR